MLDVLTRVLHTRRATVELVQGLADDDLVAQSMPDASPAKWHLAHTTWFFERFVLRERGVAPVDARYDYLFNSYYDSVGERHARAKRGLLTRPTVREVMDYRRAVDARLVETDLSGLEAALELGANHEEQHQELLVTDLLHLFSENAMRPAMRTGAPTKRAASELSWRSFEGGVREIGHEGGSFSYDNESPRHRVYVAPFSFSSRLVSNAEYRAFIEDGGYTRSSLWPSEGWIWLAGRAKPLYWEGDQQFTEYGMQPIDPAAPVLHVSYYEADACARWAGARLPTEAEWEVASASVPGCVGDAWQWTASAYSPYPGFRALDGAFGEYNGKFMVSQMVLRGASSATPPGHSRPTYRNFFPPSAQWQMSGIRLAKDG